MREKSLIGQLLRWQIVAMSLTWLALGVWLTLVMSRLENGDLDRRMTYFAQILAETASAETSSDSLPRRLFAVEKVFVQGVIESLENAQDYVAVYQVLDRGGQIIYRSLGAPKQPVAARPGVQEISVVGQASRVARVTSSDGRVDVILTESLQMRRASILPMLKIIGGGQLLIFFVCLGAVWWSARRGLAPLRALTAQVSARTPGDLRPIDRSLAFSEVAPLIKETNELLRREAARFERERGFLADAAHELRTPLAAIGAQAHRLVHAPTPAAQEFAKRELDLGLERISHLVSQLLTMARLEAAAPSADRDGCDIAELVRQRVADFAKRARERAITLEVTGPESLRFEINRVEWISLVDNLIDNAIRYTPSGGSVLVSFSIDEGGLTLSVRDDGPGVPDCFREKVFERFFRVPGTACTGSGLGLSIVQRIAESHRANVRLDRGIGERGLGVVVCVPQTAE